MDYLYRQYKNRFALYQGDIMRTEVESQEFTSGAFGAYILIPFIWSGSTASGRELTVLTDAFGTYSALSASENLYSTDYGVYQDGTDYSLFNFETLYPTIDTSGSWQTGVSGNRTYNSVNNYAETISSGSPVYTVYGRLFETGSPQVSFATGTTQQLDWCVAMWKIKPNVTIKISNVNPDPSNSNFKDQKGYFYNGTSATIYTYSKTQNNMIFFFV